LKIKDIYNREKNINIGKYLISWDEPSCSKFQTSVKNFLYPYFKNGVVTEEFKIPSSRLRCDFLHWGRRLAIEAHGRQHDDYVEHFAGSRSGFLAAWKRDSQKRDWIENIMKFQLILIYEKDMPYLSRQWFIDEYNIDII